MSDALGGDALGSLMHPALPRQAALVSAAVESTGFGGVEPTPLGPRGVEWRLPSEGGGACFSAVTSAPLEDTREDVLRSSVRAAAANAAATNAAAANTAAVSSSSFPKPTTLATALGGLRLGHRGDGDKRCEQKLLEHTR